jgi:RNA polymerase sigma factor (sigma-70 family)
MASKSKKHTYELIRKRPRSGSKILFKRYAGKLYNYAAQTWHLDEDTSWEIIYQTFEKTIKNIDEYNFESEEKFSNFIFTVFSNFLRNNFKKQKVRDERVKLYSFNEQLFETSGEAYNAQTERLVMDKIFRDAIDKHMAEPEKPNQLLRQLEEILDDLPEWEKSLLLMRSQNYSYKEISALLQMPEKNLKVYYQRAKTKLLKKLKPE